MNSMKRLCLTTIALLSLPATVLAQAPEKPAATPATATSPVVTFGVISFLQYSAELHESDRFNAFDVTPGYFDVFKIPVKKGRDFTDRDDSVAPPISVRTVSSAALLTPRK